MQISLKLGAALGLAAFGMTGMQAAQAQVVPTVINGVFTQDDNSPVFTFNVTTPGVVKLYTTSYGSGTNLDGSVTNAGGFDPILSLFDSSGNLINYDDDSPIGNPDPNTFEKYDSGLADTLAVGTYQVAVTEYDNFANASSNPGGNLSDGFEEDGQGNFTTKYAGFGGVNNGVSFIDVTGDQRTANFTLNIGNGVFPVPEASTNVSFGLLLALCMGGVVMASRKKAASSAA